MCVTKLETRKNFVSKQQRAEGRSVSFSERRLSLLRVEVYEALATATGEIRVWLRL